MVLSKLDSSVNYNDTMKVEDADKNSSKEIYQIEIFGVDVLITIGEPINKFLKKTLFISQYIYSKIIAKFFKLVFMN